MNLAVWIFIVVVGSFTAYLAWLNRGSEKVAISLPSAVAVGVVGALLTLLFSLQAEGRTATFVVEYVIDPAQGTPFRCDAFPDITQYTDAGGLTVVPAWKVAGDISAVRPDLTTINEPEDLQPLYRTVLVCQMLELLRIRFNRDWNAQAARFTLPNGSGTLLLGPDSKTGTRVSNDAVVKAFGGQQVFASTTLDSFNLPPETTISGVVSDVSTTVSFKNKFVDIKVEVLDRGVGRELGELRYLCKMGIEESKAFSRPQYFVTITADFNAYRFGHPDMPLYRQWTDSVISELQLFDSQQRWDLVKNKYLVLYANRDRTVMEELMDEVKTKAKKSRNP